MPAFHNREIRRAVVEMLEARRLLSNTVTLVGTSGPDHFVVAYNPNTMMYTLSGGSNSPVTVAASDLAGFTVTGAGGADTLTIQGGSPTLSNDGGADGTNLSIEVTAGSTLKFDSTEHLAALTVDSGAAAAMLANGSRALVINSLSIAGTTDNWMGTVDLSNNGLIIHNGNLATLNNQIKSGLNLTNGGYWDGRGVTSYSAATDSTHLASLGAVQNSTDGTPTGSVLYPNYALQSAVSADVLAGYTYFGDANLDGRVDGSDYSKLDSGYLTHATGWFNGDFNYDSTINGSDYTLIDNAFNTQPAGPPITAVTPSTGEADLTWKPLPGVLSYQVYRSTTPDFTPDYVSLFDNFVPSNSYVDNQVVAGTTYYYKAYGFYADASEAVAAIGSATIPTADGPLIGTTGSSPSLTADVPPAAPDTTPTDLMATGINDLEIFLSWTRHTKNDTGFTIQAEPHTATPDPNAWQIVGQVKAGVTTFTARSTLLSAPNFFFVEAKDYDFRVQAVNGNGVSGWSNTATSQVVVPSRPQTAIIIAGHTQTASKLEQSYFAAVGQGFSVGIEWKDLIKQGYNVFMSPEEGWDGSVVTADGHGPLYGELNEEIRRGHAQDIGLIGYSHGGGIIYKMSQNIKTDRATGQFQNVIFTGTIDAVNCVQMDNVIPTPLAKSPGAIWAGSDNINYYETYGEPLPAAAIARTCRGVSLPGATNTEITTVGNLQATHDNIYMSPTVIDGIEAELKKAFKQSGSF